MDIHEKINKFLSEKKESYGGWAEVEDSDIVALKEIIHDLIDEKCSPDPDGDRPIEFILVNRRKEQSICFEPVPYWWAHQDVDLNDCFEIIVGNLSIASNELLQFTKTFPTNFPIKSGE